MKKLLIAVTAIISVLGLASCDPLPGYAGVCTGDDALTGTTVVVDFQELDGNGGVAAATIVRCSPNPNPGSPRTGVQALLDAGVTVTGVDQWGLGFTCRLNDRPAADEQIPIEGNPTYEEGCVITPPAAAYWSYWHADGTGSDWVYSNVGALNRHVIPGGFEGWSFSLNAGPTSNPEPGVTPYNPAVDPHAVQAALWLGDLDRTISLGESTTLTWTTTNATAVTAATLPAAGGGTWGGQLSTVEGSQTITPTARGTYIYGIVAEGPTGTASAAAVLTVE